MPTNNLNSKKKFVYYAPLVNLKQDAAFRPYIEIPIEMKNHGFESYLICGKLNFKPPDGINIIETGIVSEKRFDIFRVYRFTKNFLHNYKPDIFIYFHLNLIIIPFILFSRIYHLKTKYLVKLDSDGSDFKKTNNINNILKRLYIVFLSYYVSGIIIENTCGLQILRDIKFINKSKLLLLPNSFSSRQYKIKKYQDELRKNYILFVGRIHPEKNLSLLIDAFVGATKSYKEWQLHLVGPIDDENYFKKLTNDYKCYILNNKILFCGPLFGKQLLLEYLHASIFCLPSINESFGIARLEAMANGIPVITSEAGCGMEFKNFGSLIFYHDDRVKLEDYIKALICSELKRIEISEKQSKNLITYSIIIQKLLDFLG